MVITNVKGCAEMTSFNVAVVYVNVNGTHSKVLFLVTLGMSSFLSRYEVFSKTVVKVVSEWERGRT